MKILYILLNLATFIMGYYDGDMTAFCFIGMIDLCVLWDKINKIIK